MVSSLARISFLSFLGAGAAVDREIVLGSIKQRKEGN